MATTDDRNLATELLQFETGRRFFPLTGWSRITVAGADRQPFLHNFCTNDIKSLRPGQSCEAFFTDVKGRIIGHGLVLCHENELAIVGVSNQGKPLMDHLDRYVIREDVTLQDTSADYAYALVAELARQPSGVVPESAFVTNWFRSKAGATLLCELPSEQFPDWLTTLERRDIRPAPAAAFEAFRIEHGIPQFNVDFNHQNFPQEVGRDEYAISFTKGCYLGQETVARIDALGHVNQMLVAVRFHGDEIPTAGVVLSRDGKNAGAVTSATFSPRLQAPLALAMVRREFNKPGARLDSPLGDCEVITLPLSA